MARKHKKRHIWGISTTTKRAEISFKAELSHPWIPWILMRLPLNFWFDIHQRIYKRHVLNYILSHFDTDEQIGWCTIWWVSVVAESKHYGYLYLMLGAKNVRNHETKEEKDLKVRKLYRNTNFQIFISVCVCNWARDNGNVFVWNNEPFCHAPQCWNLVLMGEKSTPNVLMTSQATFLPFSKIMFEDTGF